MTKLPRDVEAWRMRASGQRSLADDVLRLIWQQRRISRAEIAQRTGLSRSTVSEIVEQLLPTRLVAEVGAGESRGGRRPIVLEFQDEAQVILGVDMGASHISVALTDLRGRVLAWQYARQPVLTDPDGTMRRIVQACHQCLAEWGGRRKLLLGIGLAVPCPVDPRTPHALSKLVLPAWGGRNPGAELREEFGVAVLVDNDACLGALGERWWGAGRGLDDFAFIKVATGVGVGYIFDGAMYRGSSGVAGEMGHLTIDPHGPLCNCGNRGCLTTFVGTEALLARTRELLPEYPESLLAAQPPSIAAIAQANLADDPLAVRLVHETAEYLGIAVAGLINLINPAAVILGGEISRLGERLLAPLRETIHRRTFVGAVAAAAIRTGELAHRDIALGAATLVLDAALSDPSLFPTVGTP